jgi:hypothetical protein
MSENANDQDGTEPPRTSPGPPVDPELDDVATGRASPGPPVVPASDDDVDDDSADDVDRRTEDPAGEKAIPGENPEDNPDLRGEERFDAG